MDLRHRYAPDTLRHADTWRNQAACRAEDPELFFPSGNAALRPVQTAQAKRVCCRCPVIQECLRYAMDNRIQDGVWGGLSEEERRVLRRRASRQKGSGMTLPLCPFPGPVPSLARRAELQEAFAPSA